MNFSPTELNKNILCQGEKFQFSPLLVAILHLAENKKVNISKTLRDGVILIEFLTQGVVQEYPMSRGKNFNFRHFWRPSWILVENKTLIISSTW